MRTLRLTAGDVVLLTPRTPAAYGPVGHWYTRWVVWNGPAAASLERLGYLDASALVVHRGRRIGNSAYFTLVRSIDREDLASVLERKCIVLDLVLQLYRRQRAERTSGTPAAVGEQAVAYVTANLTRDLSIPELAAELHLGVGRFRRLFKAYTGRTPRQFITAQRISRAKELLSSGLSVTETAAAVGYDDVFYFMRVFKRHVGMPAGRFAAASRA